eukprot:XP_019921261.1 PREDICTED: plexin-B-like [Crassostrea gigas]
MNVLYRFSMNGTELIQKMTRKTGPVTDCLPLSPWEVKDYCGDDFNTVMIVTPDSLITCGTLRGGLCMRRDKESLNITSTSSNVRLVSDEQASALGIFLNITDKNSPGMFQNIVLFAKEYTNLPLGTVMLEEVAIFSVLPDLSAVNIGSSKFGKIFDMILKTPRNVVMDYRVVIENDKFVFLMVNQNSQSKLVKICKSIDSEDRKKVYEDIPISCNAEKTTLTHVNHGMFITLSGKRYLISLFSSSKATLSAMCVFDENEIYQAFLKSRKHRYMCPKNDILPEEMTFYQDKQITTCISVNLSVSNFYDTFHKGDYCNDVTNYIPEFGIIVGLLPLQGNAVYSTKSHRVTVVGSSTINHLINIYIGTDSGYVLQLFYDPLKKETVELRKIKVDQSEIRAIRNVNGEIYFMSQKKISKWIQETQCGRYSDNCLQCMDVKDANCGWCVTNTRCSTKMECTSLSPDYWLPSVKNECLSLEFQNHPSGFAYKLDETNAVSVNLSVTFKPPLKTNYNMRCRLGGRYIPTVIVSDKIQCTIEPSDDRTYKCESLSPNKKDCSTCHYLNKSMGYECQWCQSSGCVDIDNDQCRRAETCGGPVVTKISPKDGPPEGGTVVTIEGFNFGIQSFVTVTVAGVPCNHATFIGRK